MIKNLIGAACGLTLTFACAAQTVVIHEPVGIKNAGDWLRLAKTGHTLDERAAVGHLAVVKVMTQGTVHCMPPGTDMRHVYRDTIAILDSQPSALHFKASVLIADALRSMFPCQQAE